MLAFGLPVLIAVVVWWVSTGIILYADRSPRRTYRWSLLGASLLAALAVYGLFATRGETGTAAAYIAFLSGLAIWGWHEMTFLMGLITGPRKTPCPSNCTGWQRLSYATATVIHHQLAIAVTVLGIMVLSWNQPNQIGLWTLLILWGMRLSAKFNIFLGVKNVTEEFLPEHMAYLKSYFTRAPMNPLFPVSVTVATVLTGVWILAALAPGASAFEKTGFMLMAALMALALLEHWMMVLPLPNAELWQWALRQPARGRTETRTAQPGPQTRPAAPKLHLVSKTDTTENDSNETPEKARILLHPSASGTASG